MVSVRRSGTSKALRLAGLVGAGLLTVSLTTTAATTSGTLMVSATVASVCTVSSNPLTFGTYTPGGGNLNANTTLLVTCSHGSPFTVAMDAGAGGGSLLQRFMTSGAARLQYNLYTSAARTTVWGDGSASSTVVTGTGKGLAVNQGVTEIVYGQLPDTPANQQLAPGLYTDTIRITVDY